MQMKHNPNARRGRNRGNGKRHTNVRTQTFESNGPEGKIRGTAQQVLDKYLALGRDATSAGDPITAESFFQHAEHYYRLLHANDGFDSERGGDGAQKADPQGGDGQIGEEEVDTSRREHPVSGVDRLPF